MKPLGALRRGLSFQDLLIVIGVLIGFAWNLQAISDNSMFVHVRTGIDMVNTGDIPRHDAYSFTATGEPWVLQSWLAESIYGLLNAAWSSKLIVLLNAVMLGVLTGGMVWFVRTGRSVLTLANATIVLLLCLYQFSIRPTTFALLLFFFLLASAKRSLWWTALIAVLWINLHGSWPIGILWLGGVAVGRVLDERRLSKEPFKQLAAFTGAVIVGGIANPIGWKLLTFPSIAFEKGDVFKNIVEWQSPNLHDLTAFSSAAPLIAIAASLLMMFWLRPSWRHLVPYVDMVVMSLYSMRNIVFLGIGLSSILGVAYYEKARREAIAEKPISRKWGPIEAFTIVVLSLVGMFQVIRLSVGPDYGLTSYPVAGVSYAKQLGYFTDEKRVFGPDFFGCFRILQDGKNANVFIDDRYDMYPVEVAYDASDIIKLNENVKGLLSEYKISAVMYPKNRSLSTFLTYQTDWTVQWSDKNWIFLTRDTPAS